jgi:ABC-type lipoprotein release transport system permease subunit
VGLGAGLLLAAAAGRLMQALLFEVSGLDPVTLGATLVVFLVVALASSWLPAGRAARTEPARVLREE